MLAVDTDKLIRRRLYLQRYVTSLTDDVFDANRPGDKQLLAMLGEFVLDADEATLIALSNQRKSNAAVAELLSSMRLIVSEQRNAALDILSDQLPQLVEREGFVTAAALGESSPSMLGVATLPIAGLSVKTHIIKTYQRYADRLLAEITTAAATNPQEITRIIKGTTAVGRADGLLEWRDKNYLKKDIDRIVNGTAANSAMHVYSKYEIKQVTLLTTLDFRLCFACRAAEDAGPYDRDKAPSLPIHVNCRCVFQPYQPGMPVSERPFVKDERSVKDIPKDERTGKIGQTRDTTEQFFNRMTKEQRRAYMGKSRFELWEAGKITDVKQLVDERTLRPLRLDKLPD
jgi:hypothetical protein